MHGPYWLRQILARLEFCSLILSDFHSAISGQGLLQDFPDRHLLSNARQLPNVDPLSRASY